MKKAILLISIIIIAMISSCSDYEANSVENSKEKSLTSARISKDNDRASEALREFAGDEFQTTVLAEIQDEEGRPLSDVMVSLGEINVLTDGRGVALLNNVTVKSKFTHITAHKDNYFSGSRSFIPETLESGRGTKVKIKLFQMHSPTKIESEGKNEVVVNTPHGDGFILFDGGFIDGNGNSYNGPVTVYTAYIDPLNPNTAYTMPGNLLGLNLNNEINILATFGMVNVELRGDEGQKLQIINPAEIRLPIAQEQLADAPDSIPMWYFNETSGLWIEEGVGQKQGNEYVAIVEHFTIWNYDIGIPYAGLEIHIEDLNGNPLNVTDVLSFSGTNIFGSSPFGWSYGWVPANTPLTYTATVLCSGATTSISGTLSIAPLPQYNGSNHTSLTLVIPVTNNRYLARGTFHCNKTGIGSPNGWIEYNAGFGWNLVSTLADGQFRFSVVDCGPTVCQVSGVSVGTGATPIKTIILSQSPLFKTYDINFCIAQEYIEYSIDGQTSKTDEFLENGGITGTTFSLQAEDSFSNQTILISQTTTLGSGYTYGSGTNQMEFIKLSDPIWMGSSNHNILFNLKNIGGIGTRIEVEFIGTFDDSSGLSHTISGKAYILRDF